ncbi:xanthine dehydrogenase family protein molybdopterin-binding subunit [Inquilinus sp. CAU 1745]|uniref:xanthine dehydrogenase family protein molybdopterin-binding subunit n=1 Tax=Inquilinus sp. CAU 1745 TaxID=3140369 RepID=UPI00325B3FE4
MTIGQPLPRPDGFAKVTGAARYAADQDAPGMLHAAIVSASIAAGRIVAIDAARALGEAGAVHVLTQRDMPRFGKADAPMMAQTHIPMQDDDIRYQGQPIAIVLAETLEEAQEGARLVEMRYEASNARSPAEADWATIDRAAGKPRQSGFLYFEPDFAKGDLEAGLTGGDRRLEAAYLQPPRHHNPMEPSATLAVWEGDRLTLHDSTQHVYGVRLVVASLFGMPPEKVRVICPHTGGGFGVKGWIWPQQFLSAAAAKVAGRPVKLALSRADMYAFLGYQPRIAQKMTLGAGSGGRLTALRHDVVNLTTVTDDFTEYATEASKGVYASPAIVTSQRMERANVAMPTAMRSPVEGPGLWALESAMDELAHDLGMDPLDLRLANHADEDPATGEPWSSKKLKEAYEEGARLFGWRDRSRRPSRDGDWLVGHGMATCTMGCFRMPTPGAEIVLKADGGAVVRTGTQDIGTGTATIFPQIAADILGLPLEKVTLALGDTELPEAGPTYGSSSTMGVGAAVLQAARDARAKLARLANLPPDDVEMEGGRIRRRGAAEGQAIGDAMRAAGVAEVTGIGSFDPGSHGAGYAMRTFGAVFVEVGVDPELGLLRLRRAVGSYSAGRIINPRTARSQMTGGIIWGWGMAAMEQSPFDPALGRFLSKNLAGVAIPVNADIPSDITIHFVDEVDEIASPIGGKGIGELGATGVAAAVANAVFAATGKRIRDLPITPEKLVD